MVINKLVIKRSQVTTVEKKTLILSLPYLGYISLQIRNKLRKSFKGILNCCKFQIAFKSQRKLAVFRFKDCLPFYFRVFYKYACGRCNYSYYRETDRHLKFRFGEHIGTLPLTFRKVKLSKESAVHDHLLNFNNISSFDKFTILTYGHQKYVLQIKKSLRIKRDRPVLNKNISSAKLFLFDNNYNFEHFYYTVILFYYVIWYDGYGYSYVSYNNFWNRSKRFWFFIVKQFLDNECSTTLETLENNKIWICRKRSHPCTITLIEYSDPCTITLIEYSDSYSKTSGNLWEYHRDVLSQ